VVSAPAGSAEEQRLSRSLHTGNSLVGDSSHAAGAPGSRRPAGSVLAAHQHSTFDLRSGKSTR
jgi:hypothetical protein